MALDFPPGTTGATYTGPGGVIWVYDGAKWVSGTLTTGIYAPITNDVGRNLIHNSMFNIAQRGTGPFAAFGNYTMDRWCLSGATDTASVIQAGALDGNRAQIGDEAAKFYLSNTFTGNAAAGANTVIYQGIEDVRRLAGKTVILSFWAVCGAGALKLGVNYLQNFGTGGSPSASVWANATGQSVTLSTTFTRYSLITVIPSAAGKTLGTANNDCTYLFLAFSSGATNNALYGNIGVQGPNAVIGIWGVQLEIGTVATPLEKLDPVTQLQQCQRFAYVFSGKISTAANANAAGYNNFTTIYFPTAMRAVPTISGQTYSGTVNSSGVNWQDVGPSNVTFYATAAAAGVLAVNITAYTASADL
jgi:hypothetical protein